MGRFASALPMRTFNDGPLRGVLHQTYHAYACIGLPALKLCRVNPSLIHLSWKRWALPR